MLILFGIFIFQSFAFIFYFSIVNPESLTVTSPLPSTDCSSQEISDRVGVRKRKAKAAWNKGKKAYKKEMIRF